MSSSEERQVPIPDHSDADGVLTLRLPWPPSVNDYKVPHPKVRGVYFLTKRAKQFREDVGWLCAGARKFSSTAEILLDITLHAPDRRQRDADNFNKAIWDALQAANIFENDAQVQSYRVTKGAVRQGGMVVVKIWERLDAGSERNGAGQERRGAA